MSRAFTDLELLGTKVTRSLGQTTGTPAEAQAVHPGTPEKSASNARRNTSIWEVTPFLRQGPGKRGAQQISVRFGRCLVQVGNAGEIDHHLSNQVAA